MNTYRYFLIAIFFTLLGLGGFTLNAQIPGSYKYIISPYDTCYAWNNDILEVNNQYYILSNVYYGASGNILIKYQ